MKFNSVEDLNLLLIELQSIDDKAPKVKSISQSTSIPESFVSLYDYNVELITSIITPEEYSMALQEGLEPEFDDDIICDENFALVLNQDRELQINSDIYRFVDNGVLICDEKNENQLLATKSNSLSNVRFIPINYKSEKKELPTTKALGANLTLGNGYVIYPSDIRDVAYGSRGDAGWFQHWVSGLAGTNTVAEMNFDSKHRMKLRVYSQNYVIYEVVGSTVRMQRKRFGIWWRIKAQEMRIGWSTLEMEFTFSAPTPLSVPKLPPYPKQPNQNLSTPDWYKKKFPFANEEVVIFKAPMNLFQLDLGDLNSLFRSGVSSLSSEIKRALKGLNKSDNSKIALFTAQDKKIINLFGANERVETNTGREVQRFHLQWFAGNFQIGFSSNMQNSFSVSNVSVSNPNNVRIRRGEIYGAVKWNNRWKAARIAVAP